MQNSRKNITYIYITVVAQNTETIDIKDHIFVGHVGVINRGWVIINALDCYKHCRRIGQSKRVFNGIFKTIYQKVNPFDIIFLIELIKLGKEIKIESRGIINNRSIHVDNHSGAKSGGVIIGYNTHRVASIWIHIIQ